MDDNKVEAWPGYRIEQVAKKADLSLSKMPNVVAILAGTNDAGQGFDTRM
jgi:lysophospholipase L1-like esterase